MSNTIARDGRDHLDRTSHGHAREARKQIDTAMKLIARDELRMKLEHGDEFKLVMTLSEHAYRARRIPGSLHFKTVADALAALDPGEEIIVYCADVHCPASIRTYYLLERKGYTRVRRYAGGVADWEAAGYPLEGDLIDAAAPA